MASTFIFNNLEHMQSRLVITHANSHTSGNILISFWACKIKTWPTPRKSRDGRWPLAPLCTGWLLWRPLLPGSARLLRILTWLVSVGLLRPLTWPGSAGLHCISTWRGSRGSVACSRPAVFFSSAVPALRILKTRRIGQVEDLSASSFLRSKHFFFCGFVSFWHQMTLA
jgi:hypothetical protein